MTWLYRNIKFQIDKISYLEINAIEQVYLYVFVTEIHKILCVGCGQLDIFSMSFS